MKKIISVIVPCHNCSKWVYDCWLSLKNQSIGINNIECIFVDDCSDDDGHKGFGSMDNNELKVNINKLWMSKNTDELIDYMTENEAFFKYKNRDLEVFFSLIQLDTINIDTEKKHGIVYSSNSLDLVFANIDLLKWHIHRLEWCEEYNLDYFTQILIKTKATANDLLWFINSVTTNPSRIINIVSGKLLKNNIPQNEKRISLGNEIEICFILCVDNEREFEETEFYIDRLYVPDHCKVTILKIKNAKSMCAGYNEGMNKSDAKYKVYIHQDVRIINRNFIYDIISVFNKDSSIGIIGMVGVESFAEDGILWHSSMIGTWIEQKSNKIMILQKYKKNKEDAEVMLLDGMLLVTQYDIAWRDDIFDAWDFYDASQCMEFRKAGYKVIVPFQENPWCIHDCGWANLDKYYYYSDIFRKEYNI